MKDMIIEMKHDGYTFKIDKELFVMVNKKLGEYVDNNGNTQIIKRKSQYGMIVRLKFWGKYNESS